MSESMMKADECFHDVPRHGEFYSAVFVVPFQVYAEEDGACPVDCDGVCVFECVDEVSSVVLTCVFDTKVVNDEAEDCFACYVSEETWCGSSTYVAMFLEVLD